VSFRLPVLRRVREGKEKKKKENAHLALNGPCPRCFALHFCLQQLVRVVSTLAPPRRTRNDSGWVASLLPPGVSPLANDNGEEAAKAEELFKGHAKNEAGTGRGVGS